MAGRKGELMTETSIKHHLEFENISKCFYRKDTNGITYALDDINFSAEDGEFISIVGPSGCGKSTILRLIAGLIVPTTGSIYLDEERIEGPGIKRGLVFQQHSLFPWLKVEDNVAFGLKGKKDKQEIQERVEKLIKMVGLEEFHDSFPHQLSGGMAQRVALIRTMINNPPVFLLDEPLGALDAFTRMNIQDELLEMRKRNPQIMIMVTHDVDEAIYMSTRVLIMTPNPGRIKKDLKIDLPYPRNRVSDEFMEYRKEIMKELDFDTNENK